MSDIQVTVTTKGKDVEVTVTTHVKHTASATSQASNSVEAAFGDTDGANTGTAETDGDRSECESCSTASFCGGGGDAAGGHGPSPCGKPSAVRWYCVCFCGQDPHVVGIHKCTWEKMQYKLPGRRFCRSGAKLKGFDNAEDACDFFVSTRKGSPTAKEDGLGLEPVWFD